MATRESRRSVKAGLPPGTLVHLGRHVAEKAAITVVNYDEDNLRVTEASTVEECVKLIDPSMVTWINIDAISDAKTVEAVGSHFGLHPLVMEDIMNTDQRPKLDDYEDYLFIVLKILLVNVDSRSLESDQVSFVLGKNYIVTFLERRSELFDPVMDRLKIEKSRIRKNGPDYLLYSLIDAIVDSYFAIIEAGSDVLEDLETRVVSGSRVETLNSIQRMKKELIFLRKTIWPLRD